MNNPWLGIPLADYEGHMQLPSVGQAELMSDLFAAALDRYTPRSVALLGCAGGNGFERARGRGLERVVGVDLNPEYIEQARARYEPQVPHLELYVGDVQTTAFAFAPVELVFAGLLLEYVELDAVLPRIQAMLRPGGVLVTVVQLPSPLIPEISPSPFVRLSALSAIIHVVPPELLRQRATAHGYAETDSQSAVATGGKEFRVQSFRRGAT